ncbi:MAG: hypothetical protein KDD38_00710 [Bdellovibrionales bacterium]|nr:hypothetical protein [Bdellovibrionales bacterium]
MRKMTLIIASLISIVSHAGYIEQYDEQGHFTDRATVLINRTLSETHALLIQAQLNLQRDLSNNRHDSITSFFGKTDFEHKRDIVTVRLEKSIAMLENLSHHSFKSALWARRHHPNANFRSTSFQEFDKIFAVVNWFGEHVNDNDKFIDDRHIYLGQLFFDNPQERSITLAHEISHLVGYDPEELESDPNKLRIYNEVPTMDYNLPRGAQNAIADSYVWEDFLIYHAEKQNGIFNIIREQLALL